MRLGLLPGGPSDCKPPCMLPAMSRHPTRLHTIGSQLQNPLRDIEDFGEPPTLASSQKEKCGGGSCACDSAPVVSTAENSAARLFLDRTVRTAAVAKVDFLFRGSTTTAAIKPSPRPRMAPAAAAEDLPPSTKSTHALGGRLPAIRTADDYLSSLRGRGLVVYLFGELIPEPSDNPLIWPSINAVAETYRLGNEVPELGTALSPLSGVRCNRFLHVTTSAEDVVMQNKMQRTLGQRTGTCFQRCVGMDATNSVYSITYDIDAAHGTSYHARFKDFICQMQENNYVIGGAMTDPKGDRSKGPAQQEDPGARTHIVCCRRTYDAYGMNRPL